MPLDQRVYIAQEVDQSSIIEGRTFDQALIMGPAVLFPLGEVTFTDNLFDADPDALFIELPEGREVVGIIGLRDVTFSGCEFRNIALAGTPESVARFRAELGSASDRN
jgi:hypothetical protein